MNTRHALKRFSFVFVVSSLLALAGIVNAPIQAAADDTDSVHIQASQTIEGETDENLSITYCLEAKTQGAIMPANAQDNKYCFEMQGNDSKDILLSDNASAPYQSDYVLYRQSQLPEGYESLGMSEYLYKIYKHNADIVLLTFDKSGEVKVEDPKFTVKRVTSPTTPPEETSTPDTPTTPVNPPVKPPTSMLVRTGATVSFGAMLVLLLAGGFFLFMRREPEKFDE